MSIPENSYTSIDTSMIDASLYTFLFANMPDEWSIEEGKIDFDKTLPFVWYRRSYTQQKTLLSGAVLNHFDSTFDVEMYSDDIDLLQSECDSVKTALQRIPPCSTIGTTLIKAVYVEDHTDDYVPRIVFDTDDGLHLASFQVKFIHGA